MRSKLLLGFIEQPSVSIDHTASSLWNGAVDSAFQPLDLCLADHTKLPLVGSAGAMISLPFPAAVTVHV